MDEDINLDTPRTAEQIARRSIALLCAIAAAHGVSKDELVEWLKGEELGSELTPHELKFLTQQKNSERDITWMTWMVEAQVALLWSIGKLDELPPPTEKCDTGVVIDAMPGLFEESRPFIESARLRDATEIKRSEENIYDIHCRVRQAIREGEETPEGYDKDVVFFRHYGLSWVTGYCGQTWDEVTPDT